MKLKNKKNHKAVIRNERFIFSANKTFKALYDKKLGRYTYYVTGNTLGIFFEIKDDGSKPPYIEFRFYKEYAKINKGTAIIKEDKNIVFPYCDYYVIDDYADYLAGFIKDYFKRFLKTK